MAIIRAAKISDAGKLAKLAEFTFRTTFEKQNTSENMDALCRSSYGEKIQERELSDTDYVTIVAEDKNELVAYAQLRWSNPPGCVSADCPGEIFRLYLDEKYHGKGLANRLMLECLDILEGRNSDVAWLGVWEHNQRALSFYRKFDFQAVGDHVFLLGSDPQRDIILARPVRY